MTSNMRTAGDWDCLGSWSLGQETLHIYIYKETGDCINVRQLEYYSTLEGGIIIMDIYVAINV